VLPDLRHGSYPGTFQSYHVEQHGKNIWNASNIARKITWKRRHLSLRSKKAGGGLHHLDIDGDD
jgi:hypothetical protein